MRSLKLIAFALLFTCTGSLAADEVVWQGAISSDGSPSKAIPLTLKETYQIKVSGFINLGKWVQGGKKLANDSCYEFSNEGSTERVSVLENSIDVSVCEGKYHPDHVYISEPFVAKQNRVHFWVSDTDYDDNSGDFQVEIIHKK